MEVGINNRTVYHLIVGCKEVGSSTKNKNKNKEVGLHT